MAKYNVTTEFQRVIKYILTYEVELDAEPTIEDLDGLSPISEEYFDEDSAEHIIDFDEL